MADRYPSAAGRIQRADRGFFRTLLALVPLAWVGLRLLEVCSAPVGIGYFLLLCVTVFTIGEIGGLPILAKILLLRPFDSTTSPKALTGIFERYLSDVGHTYTLADRRFLANAGSHGFIVGLFFSFYRHVDSPASFDQFRRSLDQTWWRNINWICSKPIFKLTVTNDWWQKVVTCLFDCCAVVVVDVSEIRESLAWELGQLAGMRSMVGRVILVAEQQARETVASALSRLPEPIGKLPIHWCDRSGNMADPGTFVRALVACALDARLGCGT